MPVVNWPPASAPAWPPAAYGYTSLESSDIKSLLYELREKGFTRRNPTAAERNLFFTPARCDEGHNVVGQMLVAPNGTAYPFAVCNNASHRQLLVLWGPDYCMGGMSGVE